MGDGSSPSGEEGPWRPRTPLCPPPVPPPFASGLSIKLSASASASAPMAEVVAEPGIEPGTNMFREATVHERAHLGAQVLDEEIRIVVTCVAATPRVRLVMPSSKADDDTREVCETEGQLCSAVSLRRQPKLLSLSRLAPHTRIDARFHGVAAQEVKDELVNLIMEDAEALRVRDPPMGLQWRLSWQIRHATIVPHKVPSCVMAVQRSAQLSLGCADGHDLAALPSAALAPK